MKIKVHLFAAAKDAAGQSPVELSVADEATVADLRSALVESVPSLAALQPSLLVAVNNEYAANDFRLHTEDEVACFPPVSGG